MEKVRGCSFTEIPISGSRWTRSSVAGDEARPVSELHAHQLSREASLLPLTLQPSAELPERSRDEVGQSPKHFSLNTTAGVAAASEDSPPGGASSPAGLGHALERQHVTLQQSSLRQPTSQSLGTCQ